MTVLVTGGAGFIGSHIVRQLADRGERVVIYDAMPLQGAAAWWLRGCMDRVKVIAGAVGLWPQVLETVQAVKPDAIVHTAAIGDPAKLAKAPTLAIRVNLEGTLNFLEAARLNNVRRFVAFSSIGAVSVRRGSRSPFAGTVATSLSVTCTVRSPGKSEAVWPSSPMPMTRKSRLGRPPKS
jgi:nucleoside-diphosphate-sugar epimerase